MCRFCGSSTKMMAISRDQLIGWTGAFGSGSRVGFKGAGFWPTTKTTRGKMLLELQSLCFVGFSWLLVYMIAFNIKSCPKMIFSQQNHERELRTQVRYTIVVKPQDPPFPIHLFRYKLGINHPSIHGCPCRASAMRSKDSGCGAASSMKNFPWGGTRRPGNVKQCREPSPNFTKNM